MQNAGAARTLLIHPADRSLHAALNQTMFHQNHAFEKQDTLVPFDPGGNFVGMQQDWFRIARDVLAETDDVLGVARQGQYRQGKDRDNRSPGQDSQGQPEPPLW